MAIFNIFKKNEEKTAKPLKTVKKEKKKVEKKEIEREEIKPEIIKPKKKSVGQNFDILHSPHITEKATVLSEKNQYVFKVFSNSNKTEIKKAVEANYGIDVEKVRIINVPRRKRRVGRNVGWKKGYKKAIVEVKKGQKIEILSR